MSLDILLVEDADVLSRRMAQAIDTLDGVRVVACVATQAEAVQAVALSAPDVMVLDLSLADGSGFRVLRQLDHRRDPRVVVFTNHPGEILRRRALELGAEGFFDKSDGIEPLLDWLCSERDRRRSAMGLGPGAEE